MVEYHLTTVVFVAFDAFASGFWRVPETRVMKQLTAHDLDLLLTGTDVEDWTELKQAVTYKNYSQESPAVVLFWKIFDDLSRGEKAKMLQFVTGSSRASIGGLKTMNIVIERSAEVDRLPIAHTCLNMLVLPDVTDEVNVKRNIKVCIENCQGFGFL
jgi:hypothetical protein